MEERVLPDPGKGAAGAGLVEEVEAVGALGGGMGFICLWIRIISKLCHPRNPGKRILTRPLPVHLGNSSEVHVLIRIGFLFLVLSLRP